MANDKLDVNVYGENKVLVEGEVTMTFGLLNELARITGDINRIGIIDIDPDLAESVLSAVLVDRDPRGKPKEAKDWQHPDLPPDQASAVFDWVKEHLFDFFLQRLQNTADLMARNKERMAPIGSFLGSSKS